MQRFVAVPHRIMWLGFEDYIKGGVSQNMKGLEEPYICNFNSVVASQNKFYHSTGAHVTGDDYVTSYISVSGLSDAFGQSGYTAKDLSPLGVLRLTIDGLPGNSRYPWSFSRHVQLRSDSSLNISQPSLPYADTELSGYQFFPHELGDYFNAPLYVASLGRDVSSRFAAWKFCAYQMSYSFLYRSPNVQKGVNDFVEMSAAYDDQIFPEMPAFYTAYDSDKQVNLLSLYYTNLSKMDGETPTFSPEVGRTLEKWVARAVNPPVYGNGLRYHTPSVSPTEEYCQWENVEHFPLKSGANLAMQYTRVNSSTGSLIHAPSMISLTRIRYANWQLDRFTSANPWPQRGDEAQISVSLSSASIPVTFSGTEYWLRAKSDFVAGNTAELVVTGGPVSVGSALGLNASAVANSFYVSPSEFRFGMALQHIKEMSAATDDRYKSFLSMFYGSRIHSNQLDRPEFIGGFVQELNISEVTQSTPTDSSPLGTLAGKGTSGKRGSQIYYRASEHCVILGLLHIVPDSEYIGGLNRIDNTVDPFDYPMPQFAGLSEQPIYQKELAVLPSRLDTAITAANNVVFGYEPRYNERRARHSFATGALRDTFNTTGSREYYDPWLITRDFGMSAAAEMFSYSSVPLFKGFSYTVPTLSPQFLSMRHTVDNSNFQVNDEDLMYPFLVDSFFDEELTEIIPSRGVPRV